jgi:hypothetical protein
MSGKISSENGESWGIFRELTARARIHYKPFYLHYTCIEALFEDVIGQLLWRDIIEVQRANTQKVIESKEEQGGVCNAQI